MIQLRRENRERTLYNMVGFQTNMTYPEQKRVFSLIPGLEHAEFVRFGSLHRNTFMDAPRHLLPTLQLRGRPALFFAGQITGVEGYVESAASGLLAGLNAAALVKHEPLSVPPRTTAIGALSYYVSHADPRHYEPSNITFGIMQPLDRAPRGRLERKLAISGRALADLEEWMSSRAVAEPGR